MIDEGSAADAIRAEFPAFPIRSIRFVGEGDTARVFRVNGTFVFRFAKDEDASRQIAVQRRLLPKLAPHVNVPIPTPEYVGRTSSGRLFAGYRRIDGVPFRPGVYASLDAPAQERAIEQIARFMRAMHDFPIDEATACAVDVEEVEETYAQRRREVWEDVFPVLSGEERAACRERFDRYFEEVGSRGRALIHSELGEEHILFDPVRQRLAGVIDFGDVRISDPAFEIACLGVNYDRAFMLRVLRHYGDPDPASLLSRARFYILCHILDAFGDACRRNDSAEIAEYHALLKEALATPL